MGWRRIVLELHCMHSSMESPFGPPPGYCKYGPQNPDVHCMTGETGARLLSENGDDSKSDLVRESAPCPYAAYNRARTTAIVTDTTGEHDESGSFWTDDDLSNEEWIAAEEAWIARIRKGFHEAEEP